MPKKTVPAKVMDGQSTNPQADILKFLAGHAPEVFSEGKVDVKQLKLTLGENVAADEERYGLSWAGKTDCFKRIQETTTNTLKPCREESVDFDKTQNLFIEGDNLQVLKTLQRSYYSKVKMIYIDPPYNTGNDFVYNDAFSQVKKDYLKKVGAIDDDGNILEDGLYRRNTKDGGHYHSNWLNMMYPRLFLARNLLRQDGVIFVSIDDNEVKNLRGIMDEIFGEENFIAQIIWKKKTNGNNVGHIPVVHDYIVVYAKNEQLDPIIGYSRKDAGQYSNPDSDPRGDWKTMDLSANHKGPYFSIANPKTKKQHLPPRGRYWVFNEEEVMSRISDGRIIFGKNGDGAPTQKVFWLDRKDKKLKAETLWDNHGLNEDGTSELGVLLGVLKLFDSPKPVELLNNIAVIATKDNDMILDFFAGSGTTAHAVMQLNAEDGGNRKWICVQLPEKCKEDSEAAKAGFDTIADIAKERIKRAGKKIKTEHPDKEVDYGFKAYKLDESSFKIWNTHVESQKQLEQQMLDFIDNVREDATQENLLHELILKSGQELTVAIETKKVGKAAYHRIGDGSLVICLDDINEKLFVDILSGKPKKVILLDRSFQGDDVLMTNMLLKAEDDGVDVLVI